MKFTIQQEAEKAAKKIREALDEFSRETGLSAEVDARWVSLCTLRESTPRVALDRVTVQPVFPVTQG